MKLIDNFKSWWAKPTKAEDRIKAMTIGGIAGFWFGLIIPLVVIDGGTPINVIGYSIVAGIVILGILGLIIPKVITIFFYPFAFINIGGS
jgi:hypothetical protein